MQRCPKAPLLPYAIKTHSGPYVLGTPDWDPHPAAAARSVPVLKGAGAKDINQSFATELRRIERLCIPYHPFLGPNSNTVVKTLLVNCGVPTQGLPPQVLNSLGWNHPVL